MALMEIRNLTKVYQDEAVATAALNGVSFDILSGEFVAIMGPSGSGKSTLLHILGFLDRHTDGTYRFDGKTIGDYSRIEIAKVRNKKMGFIFQAFNLLPRVSVLENVMLPLIYSDTPKDKWAEMTMNAIKIVGLESRVDHEPAQLSGGEKQRVAIARALVNDPQVIFADEPTGNLDSKSGQMVMNALQQLNEQHNHTIILITHETQTAEHAMRIVHVRDGLVESDELVGNRRIAKEQFFK